MSGFNFGSGGLDPQPQAEGSRLVLLLPVHPLLVLPLGPLWRPAGGLSFNSPATSTPATTSVGTGFSLAFNKPTASATPFSLTTAATTSTVAPAGAGLSFGSILTSTAPQQPAATGFSFGTTTTTAAATVPSLGVVYFPMQPQQDWDRPHLEGRTNSSTSSENKNDTSSGVNAQDSKALKDENLPPVICQDVENFQKFVKEQKQVQEDISRMSSKAITKVQDDIKSLKQLLSVSSSGLQRQALAIDKLKLETAQELKNADIALRTQKTPPGLQHENTAPSDYFRSLVEQFEVQLQQYRQQIEELENHLTTQGSGSHITPQDLTLAMQKLYQTFVAQAAQLQNIHENVKVLKQQYLSYRRAFLEDSTDVFESKPVAMAATLTQQQQPTPGTQATLGAGFGNPFASAVGTNLGSSSLGGFGGGPGFGGVGSGGSSFSFSANKPTGGSLSAGFGSSSTGFNFSNPGLNPSAGLTFGVSNQPATAFGTGGPLLQLKKPPPGNKRGKR
ncbi:hypothetical protein WMY93_029729 [Mugilogobius chulae]|uniref:Nucleoporin 58 n=1 Tax=Mugilogobius chulae TaxID=88201 RepID=A0AAW0MMH8_9GOBI